VRRKKNGVRGGVIVREGQKRDLSGWEGPTAGGIAGKSEGYEQTERRIFGWLPGVSDPISPKHSVRARGRTSLHSLMVLDSFIDSAEWRAPSGK